MGHFCESLKSLLLLIVFAALSIYPRPSLNGAEEKMCGLGEKLSRGKQSYQAKIRDCVYIYVWGRQLAGPASDSWNSQKSSGLKPTDTQLFLKLGFGQYYNRYLPAI